MDASLLFYALALWLGLAAHEMAHARTAALMGDPTPGEDGRLSWWPHRHLSFWGSLVVPAVLLLVTRGAFAVLWAKPVRFCPGSMRVWEPLATIVVKLAGPAANAVIAFAAGLAFALLPWDAPPLAREALVAAVVANTVLAVFNAMPLFPLGGSALWLLVPLSSRLRDGLAWGSAATLLATAVALPLVSPYDPIGWIIGRAIQGVMDIGWALG